MSRPASRPASKPAPADFCRPETIVANETVGHLIKCVTVSLASAADRSLGRCDLTGQQCGVLLRVQRSGKATVSELARELAIDTGGVTRLVDRLERKRLLTRMRADPDRRLVHVALTPEGEALVPQASELVARTLNAHLAGFSNADLRALASQLERMLMNGEAMRLGVVGMSGMSGELEGLEGTDESMPLFSGTPASSSKGNQQ